MDWVTKYMMPAPAMYAGYGCVPACLFYAWYMGAYYECDVEEIHIRTSMKRAILTTPTKRSTTATT